MERSTVCLSDLCELVADSVDPSTRPADLYLGLEHLTSGRLVSTGAGQASDVRSSKSSFQSGDVLYGKLRPYLDKAVLVNKEGICTTELLVLRAKSGVEPRFLAAVVHSSFFVQYAIAGTKGVQHPRTSWAHIREFNMPEFTSDEQRRMAALLWAVHDAVLACESLIESGQNLKRAAKRTLFTNGLRGETQKETEIGPIPESWALTPCDQIFKLTSGKKRPGNLSDHASNEKPYPILGGNGVMGFADEWYLDVPQALIIGRVGEYCGAVHVASGKIWVTDNALYVNEWRHGYADLEFVAAFLEHFDLNRFKRMAGQPLVTQGMINEHSIPLPRTCEEQREIVAILEAIDRKIDLHRRKRAVLEELFKALLHKLMTGQIHTDELNLSAVSNNVAEVTVAKKSLDTNEEFA